MKFKTNRFSFNAIILITLLVSKSAFTFAISGDTDQPIHIESDTQSLDMQRNTITFKNNVLVTQGTIKINADKIIIFRPNGKQGKETIDGYGNPATFYQMQDNGKPVKGYASKIHYELIKDSLALIGNAYLEQSNSNITGEKITYLVKEQKMQAHSENGKRVTTVLLPSKLQNKNSNQKTSNIKKNK